MGMTPRRAVLLVSPQFPPSTLAGVHRVRHLAKHLPTHGWRPVVIRVDERFYTERLDPALGALVPASVEQIRTQALPSGPMRALGVGDIGVRGYPYLARALHRAMSELRPDVVFITGSPFYPMLLASAIKRCYGTPVVLDFQDPWVSAYGASRSPLSKEGLAHRLAVNLEPKVLRHADFVTAVSEIQNAEMSARHPWLDHTSMAAIPIGGDPDDFDAATRATSAASSLLAADRINISYVGAFWPRAVEPFRQMLNAMAALRGANPEWAARVNINFIGTVSAGDTTTDRPVTRLAEQAGVADLVHETPKRLPFLQALYVMARSDGLLLIGSDEPHYTASKIYPALMSDRPFLSLFHHQSSAHAILSRAGGGRALSFADSGSLAALTPDLMAGLRTLALEPERLGRIDPTVYAPYTAHAVAGEFASIFNTLITSPRP